MRDAFDRNISYLRISVTEACSLRCRYCMPERSAKEAAFLPDTDRMMTDQEIMLAVQAAAAVGITKIRITGGEPLIRKGILSLIHDISEVEGIKKVCITTNGQHLKGQALRLKEAGISGINISLDTLNPEKYKNITRGGELDTVLDGIMEVLRCGFESVKLNTVLIRGFNIDEIERIAGLTKDYPLQVRFIELMPMDKMNGFDKKAFVSGRTIFYKLTGVEKIGEEGVAELYRFSNAKGSIGLIRPVTQPFCKRCDKLRLTADGRIKPCLHSPEEYSIRNRTLEETIEQFRRAITEKPEKHLGLGNGSISKAGREMYRIGG